MQPGISVVLATKDRPDVLHAFLNSLSTTDFHPGWELIIVDNSLHGTAGQTADSFSTRLSIKYLHLTSRGKSRAMNHAISHASGEIILFTDDDVIPGSQWLDSLYQAANANLHINIFGGRILIDESSVPAWIRRSYNLKTILFTQQDFGSEQRILGSETSLVGPNIAVRRQLLEGLQEPWPVNMGPGTRLPVGDESAFLGKLDIKENNAVRLYLPDSTVLHHFNRQHLGFTSALRRCFQGGYAAGMTARHFNRPAISVNKGKPALLRRYKSVREIACVAIRAIGVFTGFYLTTVRQRQWHISPDSTLS